MSTLYKMAHTLPNATILINWAGHSISYKIVCAPSETSDQPAHRRRLNGLRCPKDDLDPWLPAECHARIDQTVRMLRLIWVSAGRIYNLVGNAVPRLI